MRADLQRSRLPLRSPQTGPRHAIRGFPAGFHPAAHRFRAPSNRPRRASTVTTYVSLSGFGPDATIRPGLFFSARKTPTQPDKNSRPAARLCRRSASRRWNPLPIAAADISRRVSPPRAPPGFVLPTPTGVPEAASPSPCRPFATAAISSSNFARCCSCSGVGSDSFAPHSLGSAIGNQAGLLDVGEEGLHRVEVFREIGIELMVMALRAADPSRPATPC